MPRIQMTPLVRTSLYCLSAYLIVLLSLLVLRFVQLFL